MIYINGESVAPVGNININTEHNYSTTEQVVGTWINGSTLYEKTITQSVTNNATTDVTVSTDNVAIISFDGCFTSLTDTAHHLPLNYSTFTKLFQNSATTVAAYCNNGYTELILTIRYIKMS